MAAATPLLAAPTTVKRLPRTGVSKAARAGPLGGEADPRDDIDLSSTEATHIAQLAPERRE